MIDKFPKYTLRYTLGTHPQTKLPAFYVEAINKTENEDPSTYSLSYATPTTNGFEQLLVGRGDLTIKKGETNKAMWFPFYILRNDFEKRRRFWLTKPESLIIWKFDYKSKWFIHSSCDMFEWDGTNWNQKHWDIYYANGTEAKLIGLRNYFSDKARKQIKKWKGSLFRHGY